MADLRATRQTLRNGSATLVNPQKSDLENNNLSSVLNKKGILNVASTTINSNSIAAVTNPTMLKTLGAAFGTTSTLSNINRFALGDIGNKIIVSNQSNQLIGKNKPLTNDLKMQQSQPEIKEEIKIEMDDVVALSEDDEEMSAMEVTNDIIDIDEFDSENTQLVSEYVKDIYSYLIQLERRFRISPTFLEQKIVTSKMRSVLIDWLIQVHLKFHLLQETLYLCVQIIDTFLQVQDVPKMQLQLVGVTAMFVASKYEEMYVPAIDDFVYMTDNTYTKSEIRLMEINILKTLDFMFGKPLPLHFLRRFSKAGQADPKQHTLAKYFMELSLHDAEFSSLDPSYLAASSLCLSFQLLKGSDWNRTMEYYSTYKQESLDLGMHKIAKLVLKSSELEYRYRAATTKYATSKFMRISLLSELRGELIQKLALGSNL